MTEMRQFETFTIYLLSLLTSLTMYELPISNKINVSTYPHTNLCATFKLIFSFQLFLHQSDHLRSLIINLNGVVIGRIKQCSKSIFMTLLIMIIYIHVSDLLLNFVFLFCIIYNFCYLHNSAVLNCHCNSYIN